MALNRTGVSLGRMVVLFFLFIASIASRSFAGFQSTETYLVAVGRAPGAFGAQIYSTVWATNLSGAPNSFTVYFLKQGQANTSPASFSDTLAPGETKIYENIAESKFHLTSAIGAARIVSSGEILVSERIYNQAVGDDIGNTEGFFFAGVPRSFSISSGQSASIQGVNQGGSENFRSNFILVETGGQSTTVNVQVFDANGTLLGQKAYPLQAYEQFQANVTDVVPSIATINGRITATVTGGTGSVLLAGAQVANESQDASGFEMSFRDNLLGSTTSGGGLTAVAHDGTLLGNGTPSTPLGVNPSAVVTSLNGFHGAVTLAAGSNVTLTPSGSTLTIASTGGGGGGLTLPYTGSSSSSPSLTIRTTASEGTAIYGECETFDGVGVQGIDTQSHGVGVLGLGDSGVVGFGGTYGVSGSASVIGGVGILGVSTAGDGVVGEVNNGSDGVAGLNTGSGYGVYASGDGGDGLYATSISGNGVQGNVGNNSAGVAGVNRSTGPGIYGENTSGGFAGDFVGDGVYTGSWTMASDARFKKDIQPLEDALEGTLMLRGVSFDWRRDEFPERGFRARRDIGFIAQEVETVYPSLVVTGPDGYKSVDYAKVTPILVEAIKAQQKRMEAQQQQIDDLTQRLERLEGARR